MTALKDTALADQTITYNGVQFGGSDGAYKIMPPTYSLAGEFVYDRAERAVTHTRYMLQVSAEVYASNNPNTDMDSIRRKLSQPGKVLKLSGLGCGFSVRDPSDLIFGPKPRSVNLRPLGGDAWHLDWACEFNVSECYALDYGLVGAMAFNFECSWQHSLEGIGTRTVSGYLLVAGQRNVADGKTPRLIADQYRRQINIALPNNYRRVQNTWRENAAKNQLDFTVVDAQLEADPPPPGVTAVSAPFSMQSEGPGFSKAVASFAMTMRTAPGVPRARAAQVFIQSAIARQQAIQRDFGNKITVVPGNIQFTHDVVSRDSSFAMQWAVSGCIANFLGASMIWDPLPESNYAQWRRSMENLGVWGNRGTSGLGQLLSEDVIIDTCDKALTFNIGADAGTIPPINGVANAPFSCGQIKEDNSWLGYDVEVLLKRTDNQTVARKAIPYVPRPKNSWGTIYGMDGLPSPEYTQSATEEHIVEYNGQPTNRVLLRFMGLRINFKPAIPAIVTVGGQAATFKCLHGGVPTVAMNLLGCPVYFTRAAVEYEVTGYVSNINPVANPLICSAAGQASANGNI